MRTFRVISRAPACLTAAIVGLLIGVLPAAAESVQEAQAAAERTVQELERVRDNPLALRDFLKRMPKGADLHNHLHSAVYAETFIEEAIVTTPTWNRLDTITEGMKWSDDFGALRDELLAKGLTEDVPAARAFFDQAEAEYRKRSKCGEADEAPACNVAIRYIYEVFRSTPKELVFAQALFGFELASADPRVVAINLVGEEDEHTSMADYVDHMRIVGFLRTLYPKVRVSLHAGELAPGLVPPEGLCCHIRLAVEQAKADRIGHGVDVMYEDRPYELMKDMAAKRVMVEINLTSNDVILGIEGKHHPFSLYRRFGVPVALSTDDEGISRIDLTHEYVRAVESYDLSYADLKHIVRNSLEYSFLPGPSLWASQDYARLVSACESDAGAEKPSPTCEAFLKESDKAAQQWELEKRFRVFEAGF
jgi:adenosine deaminase